MVAKKRGKVKATRGAVAGSAKTARPRTHDGRAGGSEKGSRTARPAAQSRAAASSKPGAAKRAAPAAATPARARATKPAAAKPPRPTAGGAERSDAGAQPLSAGDRAPRFELLDQDGASVSSTQLAGQPYVLYFYPKDDTPGCTTEACGFRDERAGFEAAGVRVIGVSPDAGASHQRFRAKYGLPFTLLSDPEHVLASAYGVWAMKKNYGREYMGIVRSTFLVGADGVIRNVWRNVRVNGHVADVRSAAAGLSRAAS